MSINNQTFTKKVGEQPVSYLDLVSLVQLCSLCVDVSITFQLLRFKVSWLSLKSQNSENIDYQSAIRQQRSVQGSLV